jgi:glycosyltransferase involved in cell wall biosynthesis
MAIAEAMITGLPIVASNRCGMPYMIQEGRTGYLIDPDSTDQIAEHLTPVICSRWLCQEIGQTACQMAMERFHPHVVAKEPELFMSISVQILHES